MPKVAICVPSGDMVHADFAMSLAAMVCMCGAIKVEGETLPPIPVAIVNVKSSLVVMGRNDLVEQAQKLGVDYMLFVDSDITVPPLTIRRLLSFDKDIVGITYPQRKAPYRILGKLKNGTLISEIEEFSVEDADAEEVGAIPFGCVLIKMSVFDKLEKPYFQTPAHVTDGVPWIEGEDYFFCRKARDAGFGVWLDWGTSIKANHLGQANCVINSLGEQDAKQ